VGSIHGGVRNNIIPDSVVMLGTIRTFDPAMQKDIHERIRRTAESIAEAGGGKAEVTIDMLNPVTYNDPALTERMAPTLRRVAGAGAISTAQLTTTAEDFSRYQQQVPGLFFFLGITPKDADPKQVAPNHSPRFYVDEAALPVGVRALATLTIDYMTQTTSSVKGSAQ
jgi:amidohydrolase